MKKLKKDWWIWLLMLAPFPFIMIYWNQFPDQIPTHFGMDGKPNDYSGKTFGLLFLPLLNIAMYFMFILLPKIDPLKKNYERFEDKYSIIRLILHLFFTFIFFVIAFYSLGYKLNIEMLTLYGLLGLFLLLGNYMGNVKHNYFIGVRTPWTLANEEVWTKTHRLTAKIWVAASLIMMIMLPFLRDTNTAFTIFLIITCGIPVIYSYTAFKKLNTGK